MKFSRLVNRKIPTLQEEIAEMLAESLRRQRKRKVKPTVS